MDPKAYRQVMETRLERKIEAVEHPEQQRAMGQLKALQQVEGALKIITSQPDPKAPPGATPRDPRYYVAHDVVRIEGPDHRGQLWAYSREGDACGGHAHQLLGRLTQYGRAAAFSEEREVAPGPGISAGATAGQARPSRRREG